MAERNIKYFDTLTGLWTDFTASDTIPATAVPLNIEIFPIGYVVMNTDNSDPATDFGYGSWQSLGSSTIGATTVYFYERITPA